MRFRNLLLPVLLLAMPSLAAAADARIAARIEAVDGPAGGALVRRALGGEEPPRALALLRDGDTVEVIDSRTSVKIRVGNRIDVLSGPSRYVVSAPEAESGMAKEVKDLLARVLEELLPGKRQTRPVPAATRGPIKFYPVTPEAGSEVVSLAGGDGVAMAWSGGFPPYTVRISPWSGGRVLLSDRVDTGEIDRPDWNLEPGDYRVEISDKAMNVFVGRIGIRGALPQPPAGHIGLARCLWLAEVDGHAWRPEAYRCARKLSAEDEGAGLMARALAEGRL